MPTTWIAFSAERQRDGPREASVPVLTRIFTEHLGSFGAGLRWEWQMLGEVGAR